jgi:hypothetical protein
MEHAPLYPVPAAIRVLSRFLAHNRPARTAGAVWAGLLITLPSVFNVNGASRASNNTPIDGASATNVWLPQATACLPALESIETGSISINSRVKWKISI